MDREESKKTRRIITDIVYSRKIASDTKVDEIMSYIHSIVKRDLIIEKFDSIDIEKEANLRKCGLMCCSTGGYDCWSPCRGMYKLLYLFFQLMFIIATLLGTMYIFYYFLLK